MELRKAFKRFAKNHSNIFQKYSHSVRRHIQDGICLPACDRFLGAMSHHAGGPMELPHDLGVVLYTPDLSV